MSLKSLSAIGDSYQGWFLALVCPDVGLPQAVPWSRHGNVIWVEGEGRITRLLGVFYVKTVNWSVTLSDQSLVEIRNGAGECLWRRKRG